MTDLSFQLLIQILEINNQNNNSITHMSITAQVLEKNFTAILEKTGNQSYVPWEEFTKISSSLVNSVDSLTKWLGVFRQMQHKTFIQTMKKLKSLDVPDCIQSVKNKKLPSEVLKLIFPRFKLQNDTVQLVDSKEKLQSEAETEYAVYKTENQQLVKQFDKYIEFLSTKAIEAGYKESEPTLPDLQIFKSTMDFKLDEKLLKDLSTTIKVNYLPGTKFVDANTYSQIVDKTYESVKDTYVDLVKTSRRQQRKNINNHKQYYGIINAFLNNSESLIIQAERQIYSNIGLDVSKWEQNEQALLEKGYGQMLMMAQTGLRQRVKKSVISKKQVSLQQAVQVIKFQIRVLTEKNAEIKSILSSMPKGIESAQIVPVLLSLVLNDFIHEAYGFQEEDFMKNLNGMVLFTNPELAESFGQMEHHIMKLMQELGLIPQDISNMMMGPQGEQMQQMMAQMSQMNMNFDPSALEGQNPFDILNALNQGKKQPPQ